MERPDCRCGHPHSWHEHYRDGSDCGRCGSDVCPAYRYPRKPWLERLKAWWQR